MRSPDSIQRWSLRAWTLVGVAALVAACGSAPAASSPPAAPSASPPTATTTSSPSSAPAAAIPDGRYAGPELRVSDIVAKLDKSTLTDPEKTAVIDDILRIRDATTFQTVIEVAGTRFTLGQRVDAGRVETEPAWPLTPVDATTINLAPPCCGVQAWEIRPGNGGFTMTALGPASGSVEAFVRGVIFESGPLVPED